MSKIDGIDRRIRYYLMLDDETCPIGDNHTNMVDPNDMLAYDIGYAICDKRGNVYEQGSLCIAEVFGEVNRMNSAYYSNKLPKYYMDIASGNRKMVTLENAQKIIANVMDKYGTNVVVGHNIYFDLTSLNRTCEFYQGVGKYFFPYDTVFYDTMLMVQSTLAKRKSYKNFCEENGYMTKHKTPRPQVKVETVYRYMTDNTEWEEEHQGIDDVLIQIQIFAKCMAQNKKMNKRLF